MSWRHWPSSLFVRMALILLLGLLVAQGVSMWLQWGERATVVSQARGQNFVDRMAQAVRSLEATAPAQRSAALETLSYGNWQVSLISADQVSPNPQRGAMRNLFNERLGSAREIRPVGGAAGMGMMRGNIMPRSFDVRLQDGQWVRFSGGREPVTPALPSDLIVRLLVTLLIVIGVVLLAVRQATQPLKQLAHAADALGRDLDAPALLEAGPLETRRAAQAFNRMQARIKGLVSERSRALAAVSHDLRTPLTRLRLRAELVDDEKLRDQMGADLDAMAAMIDATLDYLRGLQSSEAVRPIDINALLASMSEDALVLGRHISIEGQALASYSGRLSNLRRALQNLIDNAIKYGAGAHLRVQDDATELRIMVEDAGPGIAALELARVTEPYYRPDASRNSATGGVGLGLSIAKDVALLHGGELLLANRAQGGLCATLKLPRAAQAS
ncbi:MAG: HAMP domain-containing protein [Gammaproteobacteria bacterium]|nr:HAMP domain-containing protein [Rhodoferax sp.]MBU3898230.1 HAMP domain-containing protein [Gammaproteobacteria bacterium]MBU3996980.1 HAMP domain-containing protein [Gammaproteobacteria bacterium]MBU4081415.1 HAMP domain-containing protein [Gammaproteobacteria bacterium]MBU4114194.1 HAMP domain-containing protein [Gammaproteobacteria bacterium]